MTTFDLEEVRGFVADLDARMTRCQNGEGFECATLDARLRHHAELCKEFIEKVQSWGRLVFAGHLAFHSDVETEWKTQGRRLHARAVEMYAFGRVAEIPCYQIDGLRILQGALIVLLQFLDGWVTPSRAVGPAGRGGLTVDAATVAAAFERIALLAQLPPDWEPDNPMQKSFFRRISTTS